MRHEGGSPVMKRFCVGHNKRRRRFAPALRVQHPGHPGPGSIRAEPTAAT